MERFSNFHKPKQRILCAVNAALFDNSLYTRDANKGGGSRGGRGGYSPPTFEIGGPNISFSYLKVDIVTQVSPPSFY